MADLIPYALVVTVPAGLLALYALFRWRYLIAIRNTIYAPVVPGSDSAARESRSAEAPPLTLTWIDAARDRTARPGELAHALMTTREMKRRFLAAGIVFMATAAIVVWEGQRRIVGSPSAVSLGYSMTLPSLVVILAFLNLRLRDWILSGVAWAVMGILLHVGPLAVPWHLASSVLLSGVIYSSFALAAVALMVLRTTRTVVVGFIPLVATWLGLSGLFAVLLRIIGVSLEEMDQAWSPQIVAGGLLTAALGFATAVGLIRHDVRARFVPALLVALAVGVVGFGWPNVVSGFIGGVALNALVTLVTWYLFGHFLRLKSRGTLPDDLLHYSFCWFALTTLLPFYTASSVAAVPWWLLPIVLYAVAMASLLRAWRRSMQPRPARRMLLLRVFSRSSMRSRLLDLLDDSWRRIGTIEVVVGADLAARTLSAAALENFLLGRVDRQFLRSPADVNHCLAFLPRHVAYDGRYALNELHCLPNVWQQVVRALANDADVVLMDVRGFQATNLGVVCELSLITSRVPLSRIVLLADRTTDEDALVKALARSWSDLLPDSPNAAEHDPTIQLIRCSGKRSVDAPALLNHVFAAGFIKDVCREPIGSRV